MNSTRVVLHIGPRFSPFFSHVSHSRLGIQPATRSLIIPAVRLIVVSSITTPKHHPCMDRFRCMIPVRINRCQNDVRQTMMKKGEEMSGLPIAQCLFCLSHASPVLFFQFYTSPSKKTKVVRQELRDGILSLQIYYNVSSRPSGVELIVHYLRFVYESNTYSEKKYMDLEIHAHHLTFSVNRPNGS